MAKTAAAKKPSAKAPTKSEILNNIAESTGVAKKEVGAVLEALAGEIKKALGSRGPGVFAVPGLVKITKQRSRPVPPRRTYRIRSSQASSWIRQPARPTTRFACVR